MPWRRTDWLQIMWFQARLRWQLLRCQHPRLQRYYRALQPQLNMVFGQAKIMAFDLEMTGLSPHTDQILSMGLVPIEQGQIQLSKAQSRLVSIDGSVGHSATIHGIVDRQLDCALTRDDAMAWFLDVTEGYVLLAHHAPLDMRFIQMNLAASVSAHLDVPILDTLAIERRRLLRQQDVIQEGCLRLGASRERYGLPVYGAHDALSDALASAELLLAQHSAIAHGEHVSVAELLSLSR